MESARDMHAPETSAGAIAMADNRIAPGQAPRLLRPGPLGVILATERGGWCRDSGSIAIFTRGAAESGCLQWSGVIEHDA